MAEAAGILGLRAETPDQVRPMIEQAWLMTDRFCLKPSSAARNSPCRRRLLWIRSRLQLFMIKAVLDGRGSEIIDLAKVNLRR